jgi:hypothetical protein
MKRERGKEHGRREREREREREKEMRKRKEHNGSQKAFGLLF